MSKMKRELIEANVNNIVSFIKEVCENILCAISFEEDKNEIIYNVNELKKLNLKKEADEMESGAAAAKKTTKCCGLLGKASIESITETDIARRRGSIK